MGKRRLIGAREDGGGKLAGAREDDDRQGRLVKAREDGNVLSSLVVHLYIIK